MNTALTSQSQQSPWKMATEFYRYLVSNKQFARVFWSQSSYLLFFSLGDSVLYVDMAHTLKSPKKSRMASAVVGSCSLPYRMRWVKTTARSLNTIK